MDEKTRNDIAKLFGTLQTQIDALGKRVDSLVASVTQIQKNQTPVTAKAEEADNKVPQVNANTEGVHENSVCVLDVADLANENSICIEDLAEMVEDLEERVSALEGKEVE